MIAMVYPKLLGIGFFLWWVVEGLELGSDSKKCSSISLIKARFTKKPVSLRLNHIWCVWVMAPAAQGPRRLCTNGVILSQQTLTAVSCTKAVSLGILLSTALPQSSKIVRVPQSWFLLFLLGFQNTQIPSIYPHFTLHSPPLPYM